MICTGLDQDDLEWALDNSRRRYRVRPTRASDLAPTPPHAPVGYLTVLRLDTGAVYVMMERCILFPDAYDDSDAYALARLVAINRKRALRQHAGR